MTKTETNPMATLYRRLSEAGVKQAYVRDVILPEWWNDSLALGPTAFDQALGYVARTLGYKPSDLRGDVDLAPPPAVVKYKVRQGLDSDDVATSATVALRAALLAAQTSRVGVIPLPMTGSDIRAEILSTGAKHVGLEDLLTYCWSRGIVVLHVSRFPNKKMDGLAAVIDGRPLIVVSRCDASKARLLFILAHEVGHLVRRHVSEGARLDDEVEAAGNDAVEQEANETAFEILTGVAVPRFRLTAGKVFPETVVDYATALGKTHKVYPGTIALHWAWHKQAKWSTTTTALRKLEGNEDVRGIFHKQMLANIDLEQLPDDDADFLQRVCDFP